jgi:hypothetical protein
MNTRRLSRTLMLTFAVMSFSMPAVAQPADEPRWAIDAGIGMDLSANGNVNSGAIGVLDGQATAILPNSYGDVYGTGIHLHFGVGYLIDDASELRAALTYQSADADLVRLGDIGPSSLYGEYSDYVSFGLDVGFRRYVGFENTELRAFGEATIGLGFIDEINVLLAAPQSNLVFNNSDFYDRTASFTWSLNAGVIFPVAANMDFTGQIGLRRASGLSEVDQFAGTGLEDINDNSARITFPVVLGLRFRF